MRRLLRLCGDVLECDRLLEWFDATLLCLGLGFTVAATVPVLRSRIRRWEAPPMSAGGRHTAVVVAGAVLALVLVAPRPVAAGPAADQLRGHIDRMLALLADPEVKGEAQSGERRAAIRGFAEELFDLTETTKRSLGPHWQGRTPAEREEVVRLFGDLLERSYLSRLEGYAGERVTVLGDAIDGDQAVVRTKVVTKQGTEIPVDYRMLRRGDRWVAYDVVIEGISLVANYRTQFNAIIRRSSFHELVRKLRDKQDERGTLRTASPS